jgi:hypothetical protein
MATDPVEILHQADVEAVVTALLEDWPGVTGASAYALAVTAGFSGNVGAWLASLVGPTGPAVVPVTSTTTALAAIGNAINTAGKVVGKQVFNTTTGLPVWAVGTTAGALWNNATGTTAHTPV